MDKYIVNIDGLVTALAAGNTVQIPFEKLEKEKSELAGPDAPLLAKTGQQIVMADFSGAIKLFRGNTKALSNPFVRASYSSALVEYGYDLLRRGCPAQALPIFVEARGEADKCEDKFEQPRWNHEIDSYRFNSRKNIGDCHFDIAEEHYSHDRIKSYLDSSRLTDKHFADAVGIWAQKLSRPQRELFTNTLICSVNNLGNLYVTWARSKAQRIDPPELASGSSSQKDLLVHAGNLIRQGLSLRQISRQLQDSNKGINEEVFRNTWQNFEIYAQNVYRTIRNAEKILHLVPPSPDIPPYDGSNLN